MHPDGAEEEERAGDGEGDEGSNAKVTEVEERRKEEELQKFKEERRLEREQRNSPKVEIAVEEKLAALSLSNAFRGLKQKLSGPDAW